MPDGAPMVVRGLKERAEDLKETGNYERLEHTGIWAARK